MKNALLVKFDTALQIVQSALDEPVDFQRLQLTFGSGSKKLPGQAEPADLAATDFRYRLPGRSGLADSQELISLIRESCQLYDSCRIELYQRGQNRFFEVDDRGVRMGNFAVEKQVEEAVAEGTSSTRDYLIKINEAPDLLKAISIIDQQGRLRNDKIRKYNQIDRFVELAEPLLKELAAATDELQVFDLACGKSYLSFVLNYFIREKMQRRCHFTGIDFSEGVVESSRQLAAKLSYRNMTFVRADLGEYQFAAAPDLCISLHACDVATDYALAAAIKARSKAIIVVPCCQRELLASDYNLPSSFSGILGHGVLKARLADLLTDNIRLLLLRAAGYETSMIEYISPLDTPKNLMLRARLTGRRDEKAIKEYQELKVQLQRTITLGRIMEETDYGRHPGHRQP